MNNKKCIICSTIFFRKKKEGFEDWNNRKFCCQPCYRIYQKSHPNKGTFKKGNHPKSEFKKGHPKPENAYTFPIGKTHPNWKGDNASYSAFHQRLHKTRGMPKECKVCGTTDENKTYHWANLTGKYEDIFDYKRMCASCHKKFDLNRSNGMSNI